VHHSQVTERQRVRKAGGEVVMGRVNGELAVNPQSLSFVVVDGGTTSHIWTRFRLVFVCRYLGH
jgi:hypothetical protein